MNGEISSEEYIREFYKWLKPRNALHDETFRKLIEAVTGITYGYFNKWQSVGSPKKGNKASFCFGASAQFHGTDIEEHFARFVHFWNAFREENPLKSGVLAKPDFSEYKTESKKLLEKYRLLPTKRSPIEQYPFAAQLQHHFPSQNFEHKTKFEDIKLFIDTHSSGYVMIEDGAGIDKSRLTAYTAKTLYDTGQYQCIWHFNEMGSGHNRSADLLRTIFPQLKDMYPLLEGDRFALEYKLVLNSGAGFAAFYQIVFDHLAYDEKFLNSKLVILIDALDEVSQSDPSRQESINALFLPQILISNVFIIVTSKSFERETYSGSKLRIRLSEIETSQENEKVITKNRFGIECVEEDEKWLDPFNHKALRLVGREKEFELLDKFIQESGQFKIWAIVGPSGAGKTRLFSEWAFNSPALEGWDCRVLHKEDRTEPEKWSNWIPDKPTLLIIDYMYGFEAVIQKFMHHRLEPDVPKIRLLLIDHVFSEPLHSDKRWGFSGDGSSLNRNEKYFFDTKPLDLRHTQDQEEIIKSIIARRAGLDIESVQVDRAHKYLQETQGAYHPLFAALVGDAMKPDQSGQNFTRWNRRQLIDYYLSGERRPWDDGNEGRWASHFIAAATTRRGMHYSDLIKAAGNCTSSLENFNKARGICHKVIADADTIILAPFEPDILGESFFLKFLQFLEGSPRYQAEFRQVFMAGDEDTQTEDVTEFISFIQRLTRNLLNDDQSLKETRTLWDSLFNFMNPSDFEDAEPFKWAVTVGLIIIVDAIKYKLPKKLAVTLLGKITPAVFYHVNNKNFLEDSVFYTMLYFDIKHKIEVSSSEFPEEIFLLFDRYAKDNPKAPGPLIMASYLGFNQMIGVFAKYKFNINEATDSKGRSALMTACIWNNAETVKLLLDLDADIHAIDKDGKTALMWASIMGYSEIVRSLIEKKAKINAHAYWEGFTALMWASIRGHTDTVKVLLDNEAEIEGRDIEKRTALMLASGNGHLETVRLLLNEGAKICSVDEEGRTALFWASIYEQVHVVEFLNDLGLSEFQIFNLN